MSRQQRFSWCLEDGAVLTPSEAEVVLDGGKWGAFLTGDAFKEFSSVARQDNSK